MAKNRFSCKTQMAFTTSKLASSKAPKVRAIAQDTLFKKLFLNSSNFHLVSLFVSSTVRRSTDKEFQKIKTYIHEFLNIQAGHHHRPEEEDSGEIWSALASSSLISNSSLRDFTVLLRAHNYTSNVAESWEECAVTSTSTWTWTWSSETVCTCEKVYLVEVVCMPSWFLAGKKKTEEPDYQQLTCTLKFENNSDGTFCFDDSRNLFLHFYLSNDFLGNFKR